MTTPGEDAGRAYDAFPYESYPFANTHPDRLLVLSRLSGLTPGPIERVRVLELGCASGGNLVPLAAELPGGRFLGVDASAKQVQDGQRLVDALGLSNCELRAADILTLDPAELGTFDVVSCHGVYSWVPAPVQQKILALARACLAPHGVAYVSYNTLPGWRMRGMIRDMCRWHARQFEEPATAVVQARRFLDYLHDRVKDDSTAYAYVLRQELEVLRRQSDAYLFHEHLEAQNEPLYFHEFAERAEAAGLRYLGESSPGETEATLEPELGDEGRGSPPMIQAEQYRDFVRNRLFRTTLLVHRERELWPRARPEAVTDLFVAGAFERYVPGAEAPPAGERSTPLDQALAGGAGKEVEWRTRWGKLVRTSSPLVGAAFDRLGALWPAGLRFDELLAAARQEVERRGSQQPGPTEADDRALLAEVVLRAYGADALELRPRDAGIAGLSTGAGARPRACRTALAQLQLGASDVTNLRHESVRLNPFEREVLLACDGARERPALVDAVVEAALAGRLTVRRDGQVVSDRPGLVSILEDAVPATLRSIVRSALLVAPAGGGETAPR